MVLLVVKRVDDSEPRSTGLAAIAVLGPPLEGGLDGKRAPLNPVYGVSRCLALATGASMAEAKHREAS